MRLIPSIMLALLSASLNAAPLRTLPNLQLITFYEGTSGLSLHTFTPSSGMTRLSGTLSSGNSDFLGAPNEFYDVFFSNSDGTFNLDGEYITIEATYTGPSSSGLNISAVELNFASVQSLVTGGPQNNAFPASGSVFADLLTHFVAGSSGHVAGSESNSVDLNTNTFTAMGITGANERMSITVGFGANEPSGVPEPSSMALLGAGAALLGWKKARAR